MSGAVKGEMAAVAKGRFEVSVSRVREQISHYAREELRELLSTSSRRAAAVNDQIRERVG